jgi:hypothetical protein
MNFSPAINRPSAIAWGVLLSLASCFASSQVATQPKTMPKTGEVSSRYLGFNVEAVEVTGGRFWKPFPRPGKDAPATGDAPKQNTGPLSGSDPYQYRPPIDLSNPKLRKLAAALAPSHLRVSGTWRNSTYFQDDDAPALKEAPKGFKSVMTRSQWKGVIDFSHAIGADLVVSVAISEGARDTNGVWTPDQAKHFFDYTRAEGGQIVATEFMNEPTFAAQGAAPAGYDAAAFARDLSIFSRFLKTESPDIRLVGPGGVGEGVRLMESLAPSKIASEDLLKATGPAFDIFSYHFYTTLSTRCVGNMGLSWEKVLTPQYLDRNPNAEAFYEGLRDKYVPGKPIWNTETGEAACGGDTWASTFIDTFRFADQLGALAQRNVQAIMINTLAASDYGLLEEDTYKARPNYWLAALWKRLMGTRILDPQISSTPGLRLYAQCSKDGHGGVTLLALNIDQKNQLTLAIPAKSEKYTLTSDELLSPTISLNGKVLKESADGTLPALKGVKIPAGNVILPPASITFISVDAENSACR